MSFADAIKHLEAYDPDIAKAEELCGSRAIPVGSRVTFTGPHRPESDWDYLLKCTTNPHDVRNSLNQLGWLNCGSYERIVGEFFSVRKGTKNLIITDSQTFFDSFMHGTNICKQLNLGRKEDRVFVFEYIRKLMGLPCQLSM